MALCPLVERLTNSLMMHGWNNGKKLTAIRILKHAMEIIHLLTEQNPIQVIVDVLINSGPREDATRISSAGVVRRQAVDITPLRHVSHAIYLLTIDARESAFRNVKAIVECLDDELINAAKGSYNNDDINGHWMDFPAIVLPVIKELMSSGISVWLYSGDTDDVVPVTPWYPWYTKAEFYDRWGNVICHGKTNEIREGQKIFPSGHNSWLFMATICYFQFFRPPYHTDRTGH